MTTYEGLREKAEKATPGPWMLDGMGEDEPQLNYWAHRFIGTANPNESGYHEVIATSEDGHGRNAEYIAAVSPDVVLGLLDEVDHLRSVLRDFVEHGARFDLTPTMMDGGSYSDWAQYLRRLDRAYRDRALAAIDPSHDHFDRCCREHGTHSMPHRGCILR